MFTDELNEKAGEINRILSRYAFKKQYPETLYESMEYSLFADAKRIRPILVLETCRALGGDILSCEPLAVAAEMIHTYSLIHDDLPCMDNDDYRRGKLTNHKVYGEPMALLAGDGLLSTAFETILGGFYGAVNQQSYIKAGAALMRAAGVYGMIAGQTADILNENSLPDKPILDFIHKNKTGALIKACVQAGALCAGADDARFAALSEYGENIGLMFQIVDDILDVIGDETKLGKKTGADAQLNKMTYPFVHGLQTSLDKVDALCEQSFSALADAKLATSFLGDLALFLKERKN